MHSHEQSNISEKTCSNCLKKLGFIFKLAEWKLKLANRLSHIVSVLIRFCIAKEFMDSAILKLPAGFLGVGKGSWDSTLYLFQYEHPVPLLPVGVAAFIGTFFEFVCPILLVLGLGSRFAASILLIMTLFIHFSYQSLPVHIYWMLLQAVIICYGPGIFSLDAIIRKKALSCPNYKELAGI